MGAVRSAAGEGAGHVTEVTGPQRSQSSAATTATGVDAELPRRAHLDGIRALAVYLVVLYHAGVGALPGGFIGVDVFFVLSGFLVTQVLLRDLDAGGRIRFRRFYARRFRRLLPAAAVVLLVTAVGFTWIASAAEVDDATGSFRAAFAWIANWHFIGRSADYFGADINRSPVVHFWSLAVEEQFYLLWPLLLGGLFVVARRAGERHRAVMRTVVALGAVVSLGAALRLMSTDLTRVYYGTDTRAYQLLAGALLALTPRWLARRTRASLPLQVLGWAAFAAIVGLATRAVDVGAISRGALVTAAACLLIVAVEASSGGVGRVLSWRPIVELGRVSYGTYLWHWPLIVLVTRQRDLPTAAVAAIAVVGSTALATASFHLLELPVRTSVRLDALRTQVIAGGLAVSVVSALVLAPAILATKADGGITSASAASLDWRAAKRDVPALPDCQGSRPASCTIAVGRGPHVLLMGDSNMRMFIPTFRQIAARGDLTLSVAVTSQCPWQRNLFYGIGVASCRAHQADWFARIVVGLDPDIIVLSHRPMDDPADPVALFTPGSRLPFGSPDYFGTVRDLSARTLATLRKEGRKLVIIEPVPIAAHDDDPLDCLSSADRVDQCEYTANAEPTPIERLYRSSARAGEVWSLDLDRTICPRLPTCDAVVDGVIVKRDFDHLTATYAAKIAPVVHDVFVEAGILPP
ncbi:MAG: acyltransferase [Acidimicrobiales bacterium]|nr:acyltransferase [Acidimicrobiales bacterium]